MIVAPKQGLSIFRVKVTVELAPADKLPVTSIEYEFMYYGSDVTTSKVLVPAVKVVCAPSREV